MLNFFPKPYPGEWWYSVLCRYHVRSGNWKSQTTTKELFPGRVAAPIGALLPNSTIKQIVDQVPMVLDMDEVIQAHTLFNFQMRFYSEEEKKAVLDTIKRGEQATFNGLSMRSKKGWAPRYCPLCVREDRESYGEAFWHIEHQILLMSVCPRHGCQLVNTNVDTQAMKYSYFPLEAMELRSDFIAPKTKWDCELADILEQYLTMPPQFAVTPGYNNLAIALSNHGYGIIQNRADTYTLLDGKRLYHDLIDRYGELAVSLFGEKSSYMINRLCKWQGTSPERYAVLQHFAGIGCEEVFGPRIADGYDNKLKEALSFLKSPTKLQLSDAVGISEAQLDVLLARNEITPPWQEQHSKSYKQLRVWLSEQEWDGFQRAMRTHGERYVSEFARRCILEAVERGQEE